MKTKHVVIIRTNSSLIHSPQTHDEYVQHLQDNIRDAIENDDVPIITYDAKFVEGIAVMELPV